MAQMGFFERGRREEKRYGITALHQGFTGHRLWKPIQETANITNSNVTGSSSKNMYSTIMGPYGRTSYRIRKIKSGWDSLWISTSPCVPSENPPGHLDDAQFVSYSVRISWRPPTLACPTNETAPKLTCAWGSVITNGLAGKILKSVSQPPLSASSERLPGAFP